MAMNPVEAQKAVAIITYAIEKLDLLSAMAPEIKSDTEELNQIVNDEITRIIEEQRKLQARYEQLIMKRSEIKNVSNKGKHKEIQSEIEEVATSLRYATKVLCRNLKDNPNAADNLLKVSTFVSLSTHLPSDPNRTNKCTKVFNITV
jgi:NADH dehydrogenase/NADH:ubiquinone oxidoreductase subunit G